MNSYGSMESILVLLNLGYGGDVPCDYLLLMWFALGGLQRKKLHHHFAGTNGQSKIWNMLPCAINGLKGVLMDNMGKDSPHLCQRKLLDNAAPRTYGKREEWRCWTRLPTRTTCLVHPSTVLGQG